MRYKFEIDEQFAVRVWDIENPNEENKPFFYQPTHPEGRDWVDAQEAQTWIETLIEEWLKPAPEEPIEEPVEE